MSEDTDKGYNDRNHFFKVVWALGFNKEIKARIV